MKWKRIAPSRERGKNQQLKNKRPGFTESKMFTTTFALFVFVFFSILSATVFTITMLINKKINKKKFLYQSCGKSPAIQALGRPCITQPKSRSVAVVRCQWGFRSNQWVVSLTWQLFVVSSNTSWGEDIHVSSNTSWGVDTHVSSKTSWKKGTRVKNQTEQKLWNWIDCYCSKTRSNHAERYKKQNKNKKTLFIRTKHNMRIFGVSPFFKLQNNTQATVKWWKLRQGHSFAFG